MNIDYFLMIIRTLGLERHMILRSLEEISEKQYKMNGKTKFLVLEIQENNIYHTP